MRTRLDIIRNHRQFKQMLSVLLIAVALIVLSGFTDECAAQPGKKLITDHATQRITSASLIKTNRDWQWIRFAIRLKMKGVLKPETKESIQ